MPSEKNYICPRCDYPLIPVHAMDGPKRKVIALSCPEPYCDHMQMVTKKEGRELISLMRSSERRA